MKKILFLTISYLFMTSAFCLEKHDLISILHDAIKQDPTYLAAKETYFANLEKFPQAIADILPMIQANGDISYTKQYLSSSNKIVPTDQSQGFNLQLSQPIFNAQKWHNISKANIFTKVAAAKLSSALQDLIIRTATAYLAILEAEDNVALIKAYKKANFRQLEQAQNKYKTGLEAITSVYEAKAAYDAVVAKEIATQNDLNNKLENLRSITNIKYDNLKKLKPSFPLISPNPNNVNAWINKALAQNFSFVASKYLIETYKKDIDIQKSGHLPSLDMTASYDQHNFHYASAIGTNLEQNKTGNVALNLRVPLFQGGAIYSKTKEASFNYKAALQAHDALKRQITNQTRQSLGNIQSSISQIKAGEQAVKSAQSALKSTESSLDAGTRTLVDLLNAQKDLLNAQILLASYKYKYINNSLQLKQIVGTLNQDDLHIVNKWLL